MKSAVALVAERRARGWTVSLAHHQPAPLDYAASDRCNTKAGAACWHALPVLAHKARYPLVPCIQSCTLTALGLGIGLGTGAGAKGWRALLDRCLSPPCSAWLPACWWEEAPATSAAAAAAWEWVRCLLLGFRASSWLLPPCACSPAPPPAASVHAGGWFSWFAWAARAVVALRVVGAARRTCGGHAVQAGRMVSSGTPVLCLALISKHTGPYNMQPCKPKRPCTRTAVAAFSISNFQISQRLPARSAAPHPRLRLAPA